MRALIMLAASAALASVPAVAKPKPSSWSCQFTKGQVILARALEADPAPPRTIPPPPAGWRITGTTELVLRQDVAANGTPNRIQGKNFFRASIRDGSGAIALETGGAVIPSGEFLFDRVTPPQNTMRGMFRQRPGDTFGRPLDADFFDLPDAAPPYIHFVARLTSVQDTRRIYLRVPVDGFGPLYARGIAKAATASEATLRPC